MPKRLYFYFKNKHTFMNFLMEKLFFNKTAEKTDKIFGNIA